MKCEICHKAEAKAVIHRPKKDGTMEELFVCKTCAQAAKAAQEKEQKVSEENSENADGPVIIGASGEKPPPFVENLLKATLGFVQGIAEAEAEKTRPESCPVCGKKRETLIADGRPGCPECWHSFNVEITEHFLNGQYGVRHKGRSPSNTPAAQADPCAELERQLKIAVKKQQFEKAAQIRRELEKLGKRQPLTPSKNEEGQ